MPSNKNFEPMLAATLEPGMATTWPKLASPKLDGFRALVRKSTLLSRNMKPIPNQELQARYGRPEFEGLDGELITGLPWAPGVFNLSSRVVRNAGADASCTGFYVFDLWNVGGKFADRFAQVVARCGLYSTGIQASLQLWPVEHVLATNEVMAKDLEESWLARGYEGMMLRDPNGVYKNGRSTLAEGGLLKVKRFEDAECVILECIEERKNTNANEGDAFGRTKRSTKKEGLVGKDTLGGFLVRGVNGKYKGQEFRCGTGVLTQTQCVALWRVRGSLKGREFTYKFFPSGTVDLPRFPMFLKADWLVDLVMLGGDLSEADFAGK